jgi:hypothetical protein
MSERDSRALALINGNADSNYFRHLLKTVMPGKMDIDGKKFVFCAALSVVLTVGVIYRRARMCVNHEGRGRWYCIWLGDDGSIQLFWIASCAGH